MSRIGIIRDAIKKHGGRVDVTYYADNTRGMSGSGTYTTDEKDKGDAVYKVDKRSDGLTNAQRERVVAELNDHPDVKRAYLSRYQKYGIRGSISGGHIKVVFDGISEQTKKARKTARINRRKRRGVRW